MKQAPPAPDRKAQLLTVALAICGMALFVRLSLIRPHAWWSKLLLGGGWLCAIVGAATAYALLERALSSKK